jgi:hypothetical protein
MYLSEGECVDGRGAVREREVKTDREALRTRKAISERHYLIMNYVARNFGHSKS